MTVRLSSHDYQVAIPSYKRPDMLRRKTLPFLIDGGVEPWRITVFVHDHDDNVVEYWKIAEDFGVRLQVSSVKGINAQRNIIRRAYADGTPLIQCDDDITDIQRAHLDPESGKNKLTKLDDVGEFFKSMFVITRAAELWSWGLTPVANAFFMQPDKVNDNLKFVIFSLFGNFVRHEHPVYDTTVPTKDDYEFSLRSWWYDGGIIRHEGYVARADIYKAPGGCQDTRTVADAEASVVSLMAQWPGLVRRNTRRKSDFAEILLARKPRHAGNPILTPPPGGFPSGV